jgi:pullulanase
MYDYLKYSLKYEDDGAFHAARLALSIVLISQGIPFIHAGEEFLRTKGGSSNSYNASDKINHFDYNLMKKNISLVNTLKDLISIRKEYDVLRYSKIEEIEQKCHVLDGLVNDNLTAILCEGERYHLVLIIKCDYDEFTFHTYKNTSMIFDGQKKVLILNDDYTFNLPGVYIFRRSDDGNNY